MRERHFARPRAHAAADHRRHRGGMMRRAERPPVGELSVGQLAGDRGDHGDFQKLARRERRQDGGEAARRASIFPRPAARPSACCGRRRRRSPAPGAALSWPLMSRMSGMSVPPGRMAGFGRDSTCVPRKWLASAIRLSGAMTGRSSPAQAASGPQGPGQISPRPSALAPIAAGSTPATGGDAAVERQLAEHHMLADRIGRDGAHRHHQPERDRQVVMAAFLRQIGRREIDGDALRRQRQAGGVQRRMHPLAAFAPPPCRAGRRC